MNGVQNRLTPLRCDLSRNSFGMEPSRWHTLSGICSWKRSLLLPKKTICLEVTRTVQRYGQPKRAWI